MARSQQVLFQTNDGRHLEGDTDLTPVDDPPVPEENATQASAASSVGSSDVEFLAPEEWTEESTPCPPHHPL